MKQIFYEFEHSLISSESNWPAWTRLQSGNGFANHRNSRWTRSKGRLSGQRWSSWCELKKESSVAMHSAVTWLGPCIGVAKSRMVACDVHCIKRPITQKMVRSTNGHLHIIFQPMGDFSENSGNPPRWKYMTYVNTKVTLRLISTRNHWTCRRTWSRAKYLGR